MIFSYAQRRKRTVYYFSVNKWVRAIGSCLLLLLFISMTLTICVFPFFSSTVMTSGLLDIGYMFHKFNKYICLLVLYEIIYNAAKNKHVYKN